MTTELVAHSDWAPAANPVEALNTQLEAISSVMGNVMQEGVDYGVVPGSSRNKPSLYKPGAEILLRLFNYSLRLEIVDQQEDFDQPFFRYKVKGIIEDSTGRVVAEGYGEANSKESRYFRRYCPECESGVWDNRRRHQDGEFLDRPAFTCKSKRCSWSASKASEVPMEFDFALVNTIIKMAAKRAKVETVLTGTAASHFFTQDVEDLDPESMASSVDAPARTSRRSSATSGASNDLKCPACGSGVYDNRADIASGKRSDKYPAFKCSSRDCTGVNADGEKVSEGEAGTPWVSWTPGFFDGPAADTDELREVLAHVETGAITATQLIPIARRLCTQADIPASEQPKTIDELGMLPPEVQVALVEAVAEKIAEQDT